MEEKKLPEKIATKAQEWLGDHSVLHFWTCGDTFLIVAKRHDATGDLYCLRVFPMAISGDIALSQDNIIYGN